MIRTLAPLLLATLVLVPGAWRLGLLDPWEMNRTHLAQVVSGPTRVLMAGSPEAEAAEPLRDALSASCELHDLDTGKIKGLPKALSKASGLQHKTLIHVTALFPDALAGEDEGADVLVREINKLTRTNPGMATVVATDRYLEDAEAILAAGATAVVAQADALAAIQAHDGLHWLRVQYRKSGKTYSLPVLDYWLGALSFKAFGFSELPARLPNLLMAFLLILLVGRVGAALGHGPRDAELSALVLLTTPLFILAARTFAASLSVPLFLTLALLPMLQSLTRAPGPAQLGIFGVALLGGFLAGGLSVPMIMLMSSGAFVLLGLQGWRRLIPFPAMAGAALLIGVALVFLPDGFSFWDHFRFMGKPFEGGVPTIDRNFDFFINRVGFGLLVWAALVPFALGRLVIRGGDERPAGLLLVIWVIIPYLAQSAMLHDFSHSFLLVFPLLAVAVGVFLGDLLEDEELRGRFMAFVVFAIITVLLFQLRGSPLPLLNTLLTDPPLSPAKGDHTLPPGMQVPSSVLALLFLFAALAVYVLARGWTRGERFVALARRHDVALVAFLSLALLVLADMFVSALLRVNVTVMSRQGAELPVALRRFPFVTFGARFETIGYYLLAGGLAVAWPVRRLLARRWSALDAAATLTPARGLGRALTAGVGLALAASLVYAFVSAGAAVPTLLRSPATLLWLLLTGALAAALFTGPEQWFGAEGPFSWLRCLSRPQTLRRWLLAVLGLGVLFFEVGAQRALGANPVVLVVLHALMAAALIVLLVPWASSSAFRYAVSLLTLLVVFGLHFVPYVVETWIAISARLYPEVPSDYARRVFLGATDVRFLYLLVLLFGANLVRGHHERLLPALAGARAFTAHLTLAAALLGVAVLTALGALVAFDPSYSRSLGLVLAALALLIAFALIANRYRIIPRLLVKLINHPKLPAVMVIHALIAGVIALVTGSAAVVGSAVAFLTLAAASAVAGRRPLEELAAELERPRSLVLLGGVFALALAVYSGQALLHELSLNFSQKHILDAYLDADGRRSVGDNLFKHGSFAKTDREDVNFYTNTVPEVKDRKQVLQLLAPEADVALRLGSSRRATQQGAVIMPGWDPANDRDHDGRRDWEATAGIATAASDGQLRDDTRDWRPGQWKGARLRDSGGKTYDVLGNDTTSLSLSGKPNFLAYNPLFNAYSIDWPEAVNAKATALTPPTYYVIFPKKAFPGINHEYRKKNDGAFIPLLDDSSGFFVLAASALPEGTEDQNWLARSVVSEETFAADERIKHISARFEDFVELVGFRMGKESVTRGSVAEINMYFRVLGPTRTSWRVFMHIDRPGSRNRINGDHWPLNLIKESEKNDKCEGCFRTTTWMKGDIVVDRFELEIPIGTPSGTQEVWTGLYNPSNDKRLKVEEWDKESTPHDGGNRVKAGTFIIP